MNVHINHQQLNSFLESVRRCRDCETPPCMTGNECLPAIYGKPSSDILVVSERPPKTVWQNNLGQEWKNALNVEIGKRGAPPMLAKWLNFTSAKADTRFFWIHRANCYTTGNRREDRMHCSDKFLDKAIKLVNPKVIITLGGIAASYFTNFRSLKELVEKSLEDGLNYTVKGESYSFIPFSHPSWRVDGSRRDNEDLHLRTKEMAIQLI